MQGATRMQIEFQLCLPHVLGEDGLQEPRLDCQTFQCTCNCEVALLLHTRDLDIDGAAPVLEVDLPSRGKVLDARELRALADGKVPVVPDVLVKYASTHYMFQLHNCC